MEPQPVEFISGGARVRGRFFPSTGRPSPSTLLYVPGWPGRPSDEPGRGALLAAQGVNVCVFNPRGLHQSEGVNSFANTLQDIGIAWRWLGQPDVQRRLGVYPTRLSLGGHSYGGGMALVYAARDPSVRCVVSIAGTDHGVLAREMVRDPAYAEGIRALLSSSRSPDGPARFDLETTLEELVRHQDVYGLRENAARLADRSILLVGGWEDEQVTIDQFLLPLYRALKRAGAANVTFLTYHADHSFDTVSQRMAADIAHWLLDDDPAGVAPVQCDEPSP